MWNRHGPSSNGAAARNMDGSGPPPIAKTAVTPPSAIKLRMTIQSTRIRRDGFSAAPIEEAGSAGTVALLIHAPGVGLDLCDDHRCYCLNLGSTAAGPAERAAPAG